MAKLQTTTTARALRHEALHPRLAQLQKQLDVIAAKRPDLAVPMPVQRAADLLLRDARALLGRQGQVMLPPPGVGTGYAVLAVLLGQARLELETFDLGHSAWVVARKCRCWRLTDGSELPVRRLLPEGMAPPRTAAEEREDAYIKKELSRRIWAGRDEAYERGYAAALAGEPMEESPYRQEGARRQAAAEKRVIPLPRVRQ